MHQKFVFLITSLLLLPALLVASPVLAQDEDEKKTSENPDRAAIIAKMELTKEQAAAIEAAMDGDGPVFTLGTSGGTQVAPKAGGTLPIESRLQVFADGKLKVGCGRGLPDLEGQFSEVELVEFLNFVVNTNNLYQIDSEDIAKRVEGKGRRQILDANSTVFILDLQKGKKEVSVYALWNAISNFPEFDEIKRLWAVENVCKKIIADVHLGDDGEAVLQVVNEKLAELKLGLAPMKLEEMRLANRGPNGRFQVGFHRKLPGAKIKRIAPSTLHVTYYKNNKDAEPKVTFYGLPKVQEKKK